MLDPVLATRIVRAEWGRMVAIAMRVLSDLAESEDVAQEALLEATRRWPVDGIPANPGAWLTTVVKTRALNRLRSRNRRGGHALPLDETVANPTDRGVVTAGSAGEGQADLDGYGDDRLRLVVLCCHPCLGRDAQVSLTLRLVGGLSTREIANAFVMTEATVAQRISRAKARLRQEGARFELPAFGDLAGRLDAVLEVVYLIFNEGYSAHSDIRRRRVLCDEAMAIGSQLTEIVPTLPDAWALLALMRFQSSRFDARMTADGQHIPLDEQDRSGWDRRAIVAGERALAAAHAAVSPSHPVGRLVLEAEIAAQHARAERWADTDWPAIEARYAALVELTGNPVASLNWAIARSYLGRPEAALSILESIADELANYHLLTATRADIHRRAGDRATARELYEQLIDDAPSPTQKAFYERRHAELG